MAEESGSQAAIGHRAPKLEVGSRKEILMFERGLDMQRKKVFRKHSKT